MTYVSPPASKSTLMLTKNKNKNRQQKSLFYGGCYNLVLHTTDRDDSFYNNLLYFSCENWYCRNNTILERTY